MPRKSRAGRAARQTRRLASLPPGSRCKQCGADKHLHQIDQEMWCYRCSQQARGLTGTEAHHVLGQQVSPTTLRVDANLHRDLEEAKYEWPDEVLHNRERRVLLLLAGFLLFLRDTGHLLAEWAQAFVDWVLGTHGHLQQRYPSGYEAVLGLPRFHGKI